MDIGLVITDLCVPSLSLIGSTTALDANTVVKDGAVCYVASFSDANRYDAVVSVDATNPFSLTRLDSLPGIHFTVAAEAVVVGSYIYLLTNSGNFGIVIVDPSDPKLIPLRFFVIDGPVSAVLDGSLLYVTCWGFTGRVDILDVSDPLNPTLVGSVRNDTFFNNARGIAKSGNYCYVCSSGLSYFVVVDVSNPAAPFVVTTLTGSPNFSNPLGVVVSGNYAYVGSFGLTVVDISTPTSPTVAAHRNGITVSNGSGWLVKDGNIVYTSAGGGLHVFNVSTPTAPTNVVGFSTSVFSRFLKNGNYLYGTILASDRVNVIDVTTPSAPSLAGSLIDSSTIDGCVGIARIGTKLYVSGTEMASEISISSPTSPTVTHTWRDLLSGISQAVMVGGYLVAARRPNGSAGSPGYLVTIDVSDPSNLTVVAWFSHADLANPTHMATDGTYIYTCSSVNDRVTVCNASNPLAITRVGAVTSAATLDQAADIDCQGNYLYVVSPSLDRLTIIDVSNRAAPTVVGGVSSSVNLDSPICVVVSGNYAYVGCLVTNRVTVVDVSNPTAPTIVGTVRDNTNLNRPIMMTYSNNKLYVNCQTSDTVTIVDVSSPTSPVVVTSLTSATDLNYPADVIVDGDFIYVACIDGDRLTVLEEGCV